MTASAVSLRGVAVGVGNRALLEAVDLELRPARIVAVVGPSGGGKSLLVDVIAGLRAPLAGEIERAGTVGVVFQDGALFDDLTVAENIAFPRRRAADRRARVEAAAEAVGLLPDHLAARPSQLSGGLRKRAAIARALVQAPPALLYDEPTSGLDATAAARVQTAMARARDAAGGQAVLVVTHDYALTAALADEVLYLDSQRRRLDVLLDAETVLALDETTRRARIEAWFTDRDPSPAVPGRPASGHRLGAAIRRIGRAVGRSCRLSLPRPAALARRLVELGVASIAPVIASGLVLGVVSALQTGRALDQSFGDLDPLPALLGVIFCHHVGPLYTGLFLAGRVGARVASEIGVKTYLRQTDALRTMGASPERVWLSPMIWAAVLAFPALTLVLEASGLAGGFFSYVFLQSQNSAGFEYSVLRDVQVMPFALGLLRASAAGAVVVALAYDAGREATRGSDAVGRATTRAVVTGMLGIIAIELVFSAGGAFS